MTNYREIVTKAVVSKGKKTFTTNNSVSLENNPSTILGCWVINHNFNGTKSDNQINIKGSYDINIWYSYDNDTKTTVITKTLNYNESVNVKQKEGTDSTQKDIIIRSLKQPNCISAKENGKSIVIEIEKELGIEIVGDTKVKIAVEDDEEPWDIIGDDEYTEETGKDIENSINENYLKDDNLEAK